MLTLASTSEGGVLIGRMEYRRVWKFHLHGRELLLRQEYERNTQTPPVNVQLRGTGPVDSLSRIANPGLYAIAARSSSSVISLSAWSFFSVMLFPQLFRWCPPARIA
jgi:hypothetical protein